MPFDALKFISMIRPNLRPTVQNSEPTFDRCRAHETVAIGNLLERCRMGTVTYWWIRAAWGNCAKIIGP
jgi:hypothetical protein